MAILPAPSLSMGRPSGWYRHRMDNFVKGQMKKVAAKQYQDLRHARLTSNTREQQQSRHGRKLWPSKLRPIPQQQGWRATCLKRQAAPRAATHAEEISQNAANRRNSIKACMISLWRIALSNIGISCKAPRRAPELSTDELDVAINSHKKATSKATAASRLPIPISWSVITWTAYRKMRNSASSTDL